MRNSVVSLALNFLLSWALLPLLIPPFRMYSFVELIEALFWQIASMVGWPLGLLGACANLVIQGTWNDLATLAIMLIYPSITILLVRTFRAKRFRRWEFILLHMLLTFSFAAIWYQVLNGYNFMAG
jgi:hypothetical protein